MFAFGGERPREQDAVRGARLTVEIGADFPISPRGAGTAEKPRSALGAKLEDFAWRLVGGSAEPDIALESAAIRHERVRDLCRIRSQRNGRGGSACPIQFRSASRVPVPVPPHDAWAHRRNRCTSHAHWIRHETHIRYRLHIVPLLGRVRSLLDLQTVNAQKNLGKNFKSNLDRMIRSNCGHQMALARS